MAHASAQFEDLLGDYINGGQTSEASNNHAFTGSPNFSSIYTNWQSGYVYLALALDSAGNIGARFDSFTEVSGTGYSRVNNDANNSGYLAITTSSTDGSWENQYDISFAQAQAAWGDVTYAVFCYNDGTDNFPLIACPLATTTTVGNNTTLTFSAGDLKYTIA